MCWNLGVNNVSFFATFSYKKLLSIMSLQPLGCGNTFYIWRQIRQKVAWKCFGCFFLWLFPSIRLIWSVCFSEARALVAAVTVVAVHLTGASWLTAAPSPAPAPTFTPAFASISAPAPAVAAVAVVALAPTPALAGAAGAAQRAGGRWTRPVVRYWPLPCTTERKTYTCYKNIYYMCAYMSWALW